MTCVHPRCDSGFGQVLLRCLPESVHSGEYNHQFGRVLLRYLSKPSNVLLRGQCTPARTMYSCEYVKPLSIKQYYSASDLKMFWKKYFPVERPAFEVTWNIVGSKIIRFAVRNAYSPSRVPSHRPPHAQPASEVTWILRILLFPTPPKEEPSHGRPCI